MPEEGLLNSVEVRVLGALVEKEFTTPDYYPLSLNALTAQAVLAALATRSQRPLVAKLPRQSGFKEQRYVHLLSGPSAIETSVSTPAVEPATLAVRAENERLGKLENEVTALQREIGELRKEMAEFRKQFE